MTHAITARAQIFKIVYLIAFYGAVPFKEIFIQALQAASHRQHTPLTS